MVNKEILEGLRNAMTRGNTLYQAMMSFYNAGYSKQEIEEAAKEIHSSPSVSTQPQKAVSKQPQKTIQKPQATKPSTPLPSPSVSTQPKPVLKQQQKPIQKQEEIAPKEKNNQLVSKYEGKPKENNKLTTIILITTIILFILVLFGIIIFFNEIIDFFKNLF